MTLKKQRLLSLLFFMITMEVTAQAVVIDHLECQINYKNNQDETYAISTSAKLAAIRHNTVRYIPVSRPKNEIRHTQAEISLKLEFTEDQEPYSAELIFSYHHAIEFDENGNAIRAAQRSCEGLNAMLPIGGGSQVCAPFFEPWYNDPWWGNAIGGPWEEVTLTSEGIAQFDFLALPNNSICTRPADRDTDNECLEINCQLMDTISY